LDPDLELDPDPHSSKSLDQDLHIMNSDTKHWRQLFIVYNIASCSGRSL
jgi:hypothetical protein